MENFNSLYERFKKEVESVSGECYRVTTLNEACELIHKILCAKGVQKISLVNSEITKAGQLENYLQGRGMTVYTDQLRNVAPIVDVGITQVDWAIAETGTLVQNGTQVDERLSSSLPPIHVALARTNDLRLNLVETMAEIHKLPAIPGFIGFITGPSRTSDIERVLTIGVHGPEQLIVIFVDQIAEVA